MNKFMRAWGKKAERASKSCGKCNRPECKVKVGEDGVARPGKVPATCRQFDHARVQGIPRPC